MINLKSKKDIKYIKKAIKIGEKILDKISKYIKPGVTPIQLNKKIEFLIWLNRAKPSFKGFSGFPSASCISVGRNIIHGVPNDIPLKNGDLVKIDIGINYKGYFSDQARTYIVGGFVFTEEEFNLVYGTEKALESAIKVAIAGNTIGDISKSIETTAKEWGLGILKDWAGHGVGFAVHEEPAVPNRVGKDKDVVLKKGMVIAIEPMFVFGKGNYKVEEDEFTVKADGLSAHFEKTVII